MIGDLVVSGLKSGVNNINFDIKQNSFNFTKEKEGVLDPPWFD